MRLTMFTDFGLRALMRLAAEPDRTFTTEALAKELAISRHHLNKVVQALAEAGFVSTRRGGGGGLKLARPAAGIGLGEVVRRLEAPQALVECFRDESSPCTFLPRCRLRARLAKARDAFMADLDRSTLADCIEPQRAIGGRR
ncbi:MAG: Rrf2 family transcriptional regulator [Hyphomicrobiaceae bacterium]